MSQTLIGVAGVDVPVATFDSALPDSQLGYGGYKMIVTPTGNALLHPKLEQHASYIEVTIPQCRDGMIDYYFLLFENRIC